MRAFFKAHRKIVVAGVITLGVLGLAVGNANASTLIGKPIQPINPVGPIQIVNPGGPIMTLPPVTICPRVPFREANTNRALPRCTVPPPVTVPPVHTTLPPVTVPVHTTLPPVSIPTTCPPLPRAGLATSAIMCPLVEAN